MCNPNPSFICTAPGSSLYFLLAGFWTPLFNVPDWGLKTDNTMSVKSKLGVGKMAQRVKAPAT